MFTICPLPCRLTTSAGIRRKNPHQTSLDFAASWPSSASEYILDVNSTYAFAFLFTRFSPRIHLMSSQLAVNVSPLAWMTSQQQRGCNGMVMILEHQIGQKQAVLWPLHWYAFSLQLACHFLLLYFLGMWLNKKKEILGVAMHSKLVTILSAGITTKRVLHDFKLNLLEPKDETRA